MGYYAMGDNCYGRGDYYRGDYYRGDPGLLSGIGHFLGGAIKAVSTVANVALNPLGTAAQLASKVGLSLGRAAVAPRPGGTALAPVPTPLQLAPPSIGQLGPTGVGAQYGLINLQDVSGAQAKQGIAMVPGPGGVMIPCQIKGTHLNKSSYFTKHGYVPKGSVCVRNRRMNVANGRALRRALRRVTGFGRVVKRMKKAVGRANSAVGNVHRARARKHA